MNLRFGLALALTASSLQACVRESGPVSVEARIAEAFCDRRIVLLGELPSHGEARGFDAKARIVELLVDECGFDAVLFEAPIYDFLGLHEAMSEGQAVPAQLDRAIGGVWLTRELSDWRDWLFEQAAEGRLTLGGLDDQVSASSDYARATLPDLVTLSVLEQDAPECRLAVARNLNWRYDAEQQFDEEERLRLQRCARAAADRAAGEHGRDVEPTEQVMLENLASLYDRQANPGGPDRDEVMYRNLRWHGDRMPESRLVIWTATVHAARSQGDRETWPLGTWLSEEWGDRLASVGFTAFTGQSSMAGGPIQQLSEAPEGSLEALVTSVDSTRVYLSAATLGEIGVVPSRLFGMFTSADWSVFFDGVLVIREEMAPAFEPRPRANVSPDSLASLRAVRGKSPQPGR
jgi:erythromycin esterase-like protein